MARQRQQVPEIGWRSSQQVRQQAEAARLNNQLVDEADKMLGKFPERYQKNPAARTAADIAVNVKNLPSDPRFQQAAAIAGVGALLGGGLKAYSDQRNEYLPSGPLDVAGRMVSNLFPTPAVSADPLAAARNNVAAAAELVGSEAMVEALAADQINEMRGINQAVMSPTEIAGMKSVQAAIDQRAAELMQQPIQKSDGSVGPMPFDTAMRLATEQVNMEMRAGQVY